MSNNRSTDMQSLWNERIAAVLPKLRPEIKAALLCRLGFGDYTIPTLESASLKANCTRERVRQVEAEFLRLLPQGITPTAADHDFIAALTALMPDNGIAIIATLEQQGWLSTPWAIAGIQGLYSHLPFSQVHNWHPLVSPTATTWFDTQANFRLPTLAELADWARATIGTQEATHTHRLCQTIQQNLHTQLDDRNVQALVNCVPNIVILPPDMVMLTRTSTNRSRFHNTSSLALGVCGTLPAPSLWEGLRRRYAARRQQPPSLELSRLIWSHHDNYLVRDDYISLRPGVAPRPPSRAEQVIIKTLRTRTEALNRNDLLEAMIAAHIPPATAITTMSFSPICEPVPGHRGWWRLRASTALPGTSLRSQSPKHLTIKSASPQHVVIELTADPHSTGSIYLPSHISTHLRNRKFPVAIQFVDEIKPLTGVQIVVNSKGASWGYNGAWRHLNQQQVVPTCLVDFDLNRGLATVSPPS